VIVAFLQGLVSLPIGVVGLWILVLTARYLRARTAAMTTDEPTRAGTPWAWTLGLRNRRVRDANRVHVRNLCAYYDCSHRELCQRVVVHIPSSPVELRRRALNRRDASVGHMLYAARHACTRLGFEAEAVNWQAIAAVQLPPAALRTYAREAVGAIALLVSSGLLAWYVTGPSAPHWLSSAPADATASERAGTAGVVVGFYGILAVWWLRRRWTARWRAFRYSGADAPVFVGIGLLFAASTLAGAEAGTERVRSLRDVHRMGAALAEAVLVTGRRAAGLASPSRQVNATMDTDTGSFTLGFATRRGRDRATRIRLRSAMEPHTRRVADVLFGLVEQLTTGKPEAPKNLAAAALHIVQACAHGRYLALLPEDQLSEDPGRDRVDGRRLALVVLGSLAVAAAVTAVTVRLVGSLLPAWFGFAVFAAVFAAALLFTYGQNGAAARVALVRDTLSVLPGGGGAP